LAGNTLFSRNAAKMATMAIIRAEKVSKCFRIYRHPSDHLKELLSFGRRRYHEPFWAVKDVDVSVDRGCCLGIIGENGSGKSTLLRMIAGVVRPTSGAIEIGGRVSALLELGAGFNPLFTGRENIYLYASILGFTDAQTRERIPSIENFAEIGEFVDRPVKTYSSGMFVRLAFAVAIHMDPDILIVDEALSVGDIFFQQRCIRRIQELKNRGVTILFVSHDLEAVRSLADRTIWMDHGSIHLEGKTDEVAAKYLAAMIMRGRKELQGDEAIGRPLPASAGLGLTEEALARIPEFVQHIPNIDHRFGNGKARILGVGVYGAEGHPIGTVPQGDRICIRISVEFQDEVEEPNLGFMMRNRLGEDVTGTNVLFEGERLPHAQAGDRMSVDFVMDLPFLHAGFYYFSPAAANGGLDRYEMCDWIENACAIEVLQRTTTHGHMRIPVGVRPAFVGRNISATYSSNAAREHSL
jgi:ABC-type polysaccharide/polyol phosphate transport system ATPase subunit